MCSRILWRGSDGGRVVVGRNMDWFEDMNSKIWVMPRGMKHEGMTSQKPLKWASKYGSVVVSAYDIASVDGLNEKGLDANMLFLAESDYGPRIPTMPALSMSLWLQYYLDNFSSVKEAVEYTSKYPFQVRPVVVGLSKKVPVHVHLSLSDLTGDSAIFEFIGGKLYIYHDPRFKVMTNSPPFDQQLKGLRLYSGFGGSEMLPGSTEAADRFVRAAYYLERLPEAKTTRAAVAGVLSVIRNVSQPFGEPSPEEPNTSPTIWRTVADATDGLYFYESTTSPNIVWVDMSMVDFGGEVMALNPARDVDLIGDVTSRFKLSAPFRPAKPAEDMTMMPGIAS